MPATPAWPPKSAPRLFVDGAISTGQQRQIDGNAAHYLANVMRVAAGDAVILCDDITGEWLAHVVTAGRRAVMVEVQQMLRPRLAPADIWLCPALIKKPRFDWVLEKATELGVGAIHPVITRRCVADRLNIDRARAQITEAAEQCARTALPALAEPVKLDHMLANWPEDRALFFADEDGGARLIDVMAAHAGPVAILIGPEGGFDDAERAAIRAHPAATAITLGDNILRAETAAIAAVAAFMLAKQR